MSSSAEDKWIGLTLAISSSVAIGMSSIITKKGLNAAAIEGASASDNHAYLKNSIWWLGISTQILGEIANFTAYTFAPPILVTPLGALSVLVGAIAASLMLGEFLGHLGRVGCTLSLIGSLMIVINAPEDKQVDTVDQILEYAAQPAFMLYVMAVLIYSVVAITVIVPRYGRTLPWVYISICSLVGSVSVMSIKAFGIAIKLTVGGNNQFFRPSTYVFGVALFLSAVVQLNYYNKSLDTFSVNIVNPMYYVGFTSATIVASLILFQGFNTDNAAEGKTMPLKILWFNPYAPLSQVKVASSFLGRAWVIELPWTGGMDKMPQLHVQASVTTGGLLQPTCLTLTPVRRLIIGMTDESLFMVSERKMSGKWMGVNVYVVFLPDKDQGPHRPCLDIPIY
ncbi:DUF803-domain-containing protein [Lentinula edodes]|uniref:DUF803-domain-containing protein n=1 Tax=Lentinula edodes TaxID=5353 RepID=A0A1Q3E6X6_LENED|nr:DUF803-domain-containing protein [Lentinula edodes]